MSEQSKPGFTPGPWRVGPDAGHATNIRITSFHPKAIAKVYADSAYPDPDDAVTANAALIAAAPDMYEALARLLVVIDNDDRAGDAMEALEAARAALTKARGEPA